MSDERNATGNDPLGERHSARGEPPRTEEGLTDWTIPVIPSVRVDPEDWTWAREREVEAAPDITPDEVAVVLLVHQAAAWLPRTLAALRRSDERAGVQVAVDLGCDDGSSELLDDAVGEGLLEDVIRAEATTTPGQAVEQVVEGLPDGITHLWILHDDVEVRPDSLRNLLREASRRPHADVLFPTLLKPSRRNYPEFIDEQGQSVSSAGGRVLPVVDQGDIDQQQADPAPVLGGSTAGMLVRLEAWRALGGFEPALPLFRDGVDFGWRANEAGMVVRTAPTCTVHHRQAGRGWQRESTLAPRPDTADRLAGMRMVAARTGHPTRTSLVLLLSAMWRALVLLLGKAPSRAADEWRAGWSLWRTRSTTREMSNRLEEFHSHCDPDDIDNTRRLLPTRRRVWARMVDRYAGDLSDRMHPWRDEDHTTIDDLTGDDFAAREHRRVVNPYTVMLGVMLVCGLVAGRGLYGPGRVTSTWLAPAPRHLADAWGRWLTASPGLPGSNSPWLSLPALGSVLAIGEPEVMVRICLVLLPLLAAMSAHRLLHHVTGLGLTTVLLSSLWGLVPVVGGGLARGSVTALVLSVALPHLTLHVWRLLSPSTIDVPELRGAGVGSRQVGGLSSAGGLALWSAVVVQVVPAMWVVDLVVALLLLVSPPRRPALGAVVALGPLVVISPWIPRLVAEPARLVTCAEPLLMPDPGTRSGWWLLLGGAVVPGTAPLPFLLVVMVPLWIATLWAVWRLIVDRGASVGSLSGHPRARVLVLGLCHLGCLALAGVAAARMVPLWGVMVHPSIEAWQLLGIGFLVVLVAAARQSALLGRAEVDAWGDRGTRTLGEILVAVGNRWLPTVLAVSVLAGTVWWIVGGARGPLHTTSADRPAYVRAVEDSARRTRTLMVTVHGRDVAWNLVDSTVPTWGTGERPPVSSDPRIADTARDLALSVATGAVPDDLASRLAALGVAHVWLRGADGDVVSQVGDASGLTSAHTDPTTTVWTVDGRPSRARLSAAGGESPVNGSVRRSGTLTILEPRDDRWRVEVGGTRLEATGHPEVGESFAVGSARGSLNWSMPTQGWACAVELGGILVLLVLAGPQAVRRVHTSPRRSVAAGGRGRRARRRQEDS